MDPITVVILQGLFGTGSWALGKLLDGLSDDLKGLLSEATNTRTGRDEAIQRLQFNEAEGASLDSHFFSLLEGQKMVKSGVRLSLYMTVLNGVVEMSVHAGRDLVVEGFLDSELRVTVFTVDRDAVQEDGWIYMLSEAEDKAWLNPGSSTQVRVGTVDSISERRRRIGDLRAGIAAAPPYRISNRSLNELRQINEIHDLTFKYWNGEVVQIDVSLSALRAMVGSISKIIEADSGPLHELLHRRE